MKHPSLLLIVNSSLVHKRLSMGLRSSIMRTRSRCCLVLKDYRLRPSCVGGAPSTGRPGAPACASQPLLPPHGVVPAFERVPKARKSPEGSPPTSTPLEQI